MSTILRDGQQLILKTSNHSQSLLDPRAAARSDVSKHDHGMVCLMAMVCRYDQPKVHSGSTSTEVSEGPQKSSRRKYDHEEQLRAHGQFDKSRSIAKGSWGISDKCIERATSSDVAITFIPRGARITQRLREEILFHHSSLQHPHLSNIVQVFGLPTYLAVAKQYTNGWSLYHYAQKRGKMAENEARWYFQQMAIALDYMHRKDCPHQDLKLENAILSFRKNAPPLLVLNGFKMAKHERLYTTRMSSGVHREYKPPERWGKHNIRKPDKATDLWCLGVILFYLVHKDFPFDIPSGSIDEDEEKAELLMDLEFPEESPSSGELRNLLEGLLLYDPEERLTIRDVLEHPWFLDRLPPTVISMNDRLIEKEQALLQAHQTGQRQTSEEVRQILEEARTTPAPQDIWKDMVTTSVYDDHQHQNLEGEEHRDVTAVYSLPAKGKDVFTAA